MILNFIIKLKFLIPWGEWAKLLKISEELMLTHSVPGDSLREPE